MATTHRHRPPSNLPYSAGSGDPFLINPRYFSRVLIHFSATFQVSFVPAVGLGHYFFRPSLMQTLKEGRECFRATDQVSVPVDSLRLKPKQGLEYKSIPKQTSNLSSDAFVGSKTEQPRGSDSSALL